LVQREMERGRSPLASIARVSASWVAPPERSGNDTRKQRTETATGFKSRSGLGRRRCTKHKSVALRPGGWLGLMAEAYSRSRKANWLGKKNLESRVRGIFQRDDAPGIGAVQMTSERVARGAGPVQLLVGAHRGANRKRHFSATPTTRQHVHGRRFYGAIPAPS